MKLSTDHITQHFAQIWYEITASVAVIHAEMTLFE